MVAYSPRVRGEHIRSSVAAPRMRSRSSGATAVPSPSGPTTKRAVDTGRILPQGRVRSPGRRGAPLLLSAWISLILRVGPLALLCRGGPKQAHLADHTGPTRDDRGGDPTAAFGRLRLRHYRGINRLH